ncbi:MAG: hypothetical protein PHN59_03380 [Candidatus Omnitrophica bacterium]|nr:hypothetical protein [Candidatus Omnitrophota bacterium]
MKTLLIYYSHYGHTYNVANAFQESFGKIGSVDTYELEYLKSRQGLIKRAFFRLYPALVNLAPVPLDLKDYDLLCLGVPVWGGRPSAPVTKYLQLCKNIDGKVIICFFVYGIEASALTCFSFVSKLLKRKGRPTIIPVYVPWEKAQQEEFLAKAIGEAMEKLPTHPPH